MTDNKVRELVAKWRERAGEVEELFGSERESVFAHAEVLRMCANELAATAPQPAPPDDELLSKCERCQQYKQTLMVNTGFAGESELLCADCIFTERCAMEDEIERVREMEATQPQPASIGTQFEYDCPKCEGVAGKSCMDCKSTGKLIGIRQPASTGDVRDALERCIQDLESFQQQLARTDGGKGGHGKSVPHSSGLLMAKAVLAAGPASTGEGGIGTVGSPANIRATWKRLASDVFDEDGECVEAALDRLIAYSALRTGEGGTALAEALKWALNHVVPDEEMGADEVVKWRENYANARAALRSTSPVEEKHES